MNKSNKSSLFKASLMAALLAGAFSAHAAGLGKLTVYSAIGQPLNAELALSASPEELTSLSAKLASHNAFRDAGIEFMPALTALRFNVVKSGTGQSVIRLYTDNPLNEPFLHFLVELNWSTGRMVREYTFLLDPPEMLQASKPASVVAPAVPLGTTAPQVTPLPPPPAAKVKETPPPSPAVTPAPSAAVSAKADQPVKRAPQADEYRVKAGDTLGKIARENKADNVSLDQMLVALFNSNRDAFDGGNMNRLRAGKILRVPDAADAAAVDAGEARKLVIGQAADFNAYRRRLAEAAGSAPASDAPAQQEVSGKIRPPAEAKAPAAPVQDKLEVSRTEAAKSARQAKAALEEELIARDKALREASERIAQLEKNLENLKQLVEIKSQSGAQLQQQAKPAPVPAAPAPAQAPAVEKKPEPAPVAKPVESAPPVAAPAPVPAPGGEKPAEAAAPAEKPVDAAPVADKPAAPPAAPATEKPAAPPAAKKPVAPPPPLPEPSFADENPEIVFGGGGLLALLFGYFGYAAWRKKKQAAAAATDEMPQSFAALDQAESVAAAPAPEVSAEPAADSGEISILGDFSESGALTTEENVDPVAEADVLMAYGRDAQAEEILLEGLKNDPTRAAIHLKLLELYAQRRDAVHFESVAADLHALTSGAGGEWEKAVLLARDLGVAHGVFAGTGEAEDLPPAAVEEIPASMSEEQEAGSTMILDSSPVATAEPAAPEMGNGLDFDLDLGTTSAPPAASAEAPAQQEAGEEVMSLDFDFDLGTPEPVAAAEEVQAASAEVPVESGNAIDFSLDIGSAPSAAAPAEAEVAAPAGNEIDFDLDLGSDAAAPAAEASLAEEQSVELPVAAAEEVSAAEPVDAAKLDFDMDLGEIPEAAPAAMEPPLDLADISLDLDQAEAAAPELEVELPAAAVEASEPLAALDLPAVELPADEAPAAEFDLDLGMDLPEEAQAAPEAAAEPAPAPKSALAAVELPDIDLSLDAAGTAEASAEPAAATEFDLESGAELAEAVDAVEELDDPEVATKLELAQAYEEMGDREGARELLMEVLNEGSPAQRATAQARLDQLAV